MKRVIKGTEPVSFTEWKALENEQWTPTYRDLKHPQKKQLHTSLLNEQGYACCYCGDKITLDSSHIEHFRPQKHFRHLGLEYINLHASCQGETETPKPAHCGHSKKSDFCEDTHISPLEDDCENRFKFTLLGEIKGNDDSPAESMINLLALDIEFLNSRRKEKLEGIFDNAFLADFTMEELETIIQRSRQPLSGQYEAFDHVVARYAEQLLGH
ncbi:retron system putative HNH endonuclease [Pseudomonas kitaguniensis]|uniref:retron system putative HNH endonuclease n=1 Tax=Pseudomonas kitaguniensis TaxID=2607908 RepID=UPI000F00BA0A